MRELSKEDIWKVLFPRVVAYTNSTNLVEALAEYLQVQPTAVQRWRQDAPMALGERLIRLWHVMAALGYSSPEINKIPPYNRYLGELLAFKVITMEQVLYAVNVRSDASAMGILRGRNPSKPTLLLDDLKAHDDKLKQLKRQTIIVLGSASAGVSVVTTPVAQPIDSGSAPSQLSPISASKADEGAAYNAAESVQRTVLSLRFLASDAHTDETRQLLMTLTKGLNELEGAIAELQA